jgi:hypothetical protein
MSQSVADGLDADTGREWSDAELTELGNMLVRGLSIEGIGQLQPAVAGSLSHAGRRQPQPKRGNIYAATMYFARAEIGLGEDV